MVGGNRYQCSRVGEPVHVPGERRRVGVPMSPRFRSRLPQEATCVGFVNGFNRRTMRGWRTLPVILHNVKTLHCQPRSLWRVGSPSKTQANVGESRGGHHA